MINESGKETRDLFREEGFSLTLEEYDDSWRSPDHCMNMKLFESAENVMKVDWLDEKSPRHMPKDFHVFNKSDTDILQQVLADEGNSVEFLHQLGVLIIDEYLKVCDQSNSASESYRSIPHAVYPFAFECSNGCQNMYTKRVGGRK